MATPTPSAPAQSETIRNHAAFIWSVADLLRGIDGSLKLYIGGFSETAKDIIDKFEFGIQIDRLRRANLLFSGSLS
jgi:hypothetical protein